MVCENMAISYQVQTKYVQPVHFGQETENVTAPENVLQFQAHQKKANVLFQKET